MDFQDIKNKINGPVFPIVTPFTEDFKVDYDKIKDYIDFLYDGGARIFHVMVHTSRFGLLDYFEMIKLNKTVATHIKLKYNDCIVIVAEPLYNSTAVSIEFAKNAENDGADVIGLIFMERYYFDSQIYEYFEAVANNCKIGLLIHEQQLNTIHGTKLMPFPIKVLNNIADIDNVVAIKEDAKEDDYTKKVVKILKDRISIIVSGGSKEQFMQFSHMGCQAYLVGVASFDPGIAINFYNSYLNDKTKNCWNIINKIERPFFEVSKKIGWHISLKSAMDILGIMSRIERPPLSKLPEKQHSEIKNILNKIGYGG